MTTPLVRSSGGRLADGQWHRLHPATPLLRGGIAFVAILGIVIINLRDVAIEVLFRDPINEGGDGRRPDPLTFVLENGLIGFVILAVIAVLVLCIAGFYISWRMHTFRITDELVEVRSGVLFRTNRRGRLDRIQGINIVRPFLARLFGAAKLEVNVAGQDANVQLAYLGSAAADELRREILLLASGTVGQQEAPREAGLTVHAAAGAPTTSSGGLIERRVGEFIAPELDPNAVEPTSVVRINLGRLAGSLLLSGFTIWIIIGAVLTGVFVARTGEFFVLIGIIPAFIGVVSVYVSRFTRSIRYSIAATPDGIRVGFGLLSTSNETLPPGRIHAIQVSQPLLWRPAGWWHIQLNRASNSWTNGASGQANTTILPVGNLDDVHKVLELMLPGAIDGDAAALLERGLLSRGGDDGFQNSPRRAAILRWFSWRRNGFAVHPGFVLFRHGAILRELVIVPHARAQSIALSNGPLYRRLRVSRVRVHTVAGPVTAELGALDEGDALELFGELASRAVTAANSDTTHRWRVS
ncbi:MAG: PH domain-containing protein [Salinibacterium sp.]|nr:PH domain-containing protein [Salinibacterium sp.]